MDEVPHARAATPGGAGGVWSIFACPHCALPLTVGATSAACPTGHAFDRARQGYLNLLVGGRLASAKVAGDAPEALVARRRFFASGHYAPIADAVAAAVGAPPGVVLDIGCGEGFYLGRLAAGHRAGLDISKTAVRMSATALPDASFVVASSYRMPVAAESVEVVVSVFAPRPVAEVSRVLAEGGRFVSVAPAAGHLAEIAPPVEQLERRVDRAERRDVAPSPDARRLTFTLNLDASAISDLVEMTPLAWHSHAHDRITAGQRAVTVDVWVSDTPRSGLSPLN